MSGPPPIVPVAPFTVRVGSDFDAVYVTPVGELDLATVRRFRAELDEVIATRSARVVVDLRELEYIDSTGLHVLIEFNAAAERDGWDLLLLQGKPATRRLFEITGTLDRLPFRSVLGNAS